MSSKCSSKHAEKGFPRPPVAPQEPEAFCRKKPRNRILQDHIPQISSDIYTQLHQVMDRLQQAWSIAFNSAASFRILLGAVVFKDVAIQYIYIVVKGSNDLASIEFIFCISRKTSKIFFFFRLVFLYNYIPITFINYISYVYIEQTSIHSY